MKAAMISHLQFKVLSVPLITTVQKGLLTLPFCFSLLATTAAHHLPQELWAGPEAQGEPASLWEGRNLPWN